jgi:hypothetical protein
MKSGIVVVTIAGFCAVLFGWLSLMSWHTYQADGNQFIVTSISQVRGTTTLVRAVEFGAVALICILIFLGGILAFVYPRDGKQLKPSNGDNAQAEVATRLDAPSEWRCPGCGEENPANFDECWKCLAARPGENAG